jgi:hypothetical protein
MPRSLPMLLWALVSVLDGFSVAATSLDVSLSTGTFRGATTPNGTEKWLGIPFAEPPVGALRFKAPVPIVKSVKGITSATSFGNACPQPPAASLGAPVGEDCLFLNVCPEKFLSLLCSLTVTQVWRPENTNANSKLPVLFWIHVRLSSTNNYLVLSNPGRRIHHQVI